MRKTLFISGLGLLLIFAILGCSSQSGETGSGQSGEDSATDNSIQDQQLDEEQAETEVATEITGEMIAEDDYVEIGEMV